MANRLAQETSPYLLQHANNPVDWYPWSAEALERAVREDKPILLSIGYAACHWCHVMEHESFEDEATAKLMNERFVNIKVDREERPDLDAIYMTAVQSMTGHGGWPMTMFLTPDAVPFYAGTYFPGEDRPGMPSFRRILVSVSDAYSSRRDDVERTASRLREMYDRASQSSSTGGALSTRTLELGYRGIAQRYDVRYGGFEGAPKFPQAMALDFLLRYWRRAGESYALEMVLGSFRKMARGGIYDQVGGGFHRYSVDAIWLVPHFEKMLYDNALLARLGVHLYQATGDAEVERVTRETIDWVAREMTSPSGGFYSSLDADSEGEEGKFYVWSDTELNELLGEDAALVKSYYGATVGGNFEDHNILFVPADTSAIARRAGVSEAELDRAIARARAALYAARSKRVWPGLDDKVIASWNGLMLRAIAEAARVFESTEYRVLALRSAEFLWSALVHDDTAGNRVFRVHSRGVAKIPGFLEDYAALALAFIAVYQLTFDRRWLDRARSLGEAVNELFWDDDAKQFFDTASDAERLITRPRETTDNAVPSGSSLAAELMLLLAEYFDERTFRARADTVTSSLADQVARYPTAFGHLLGVMDMTLNGCLEIGLAGDPGSEAFRSFSAVIARTYIPGLVLTGGAPDSAAIHGIPLLEGRGLVDGKMAAYVCRNYSCDRPVTDPAALAEALEARPAINIDS